MATCWWVQTQYVGSWKNCLDFWTVIPGCCPQVGIGGLFSLQPGLHSGDTLLLSVWPNVLSLLRWARPMRWESEMGTDPLRFQRGLEKLTKTRLWRTQWVNLVAQRDHQKLESSTLINRGWGSHFRRYPSLLETNMNYCLKSWALEGKVHFYVYFST